MKNWVSFSAVFGLVLAGAALGYADSEKPKCPEEAAKEQEKKPHACALRLSSSAAELLKKATNQEKLSLLRRLGVPLYLYIKTDDAMQTESYYSYEGGGDKPQITLSSRAGRLIEMLSTIEEKKLGNIDFEELRYFGKAAQEWEDFENKCRTWPEYPSEGYYLGQLQNFLESLKKKIVLTADSRASDPLQALGSGHFEDKLSEARAELEKKHQAMILAQAGGAKVDQEERARVASSLDALNRIFNGVGRPLTPAALFDLVQTIPEPRFSKKEWVFLARHFPMGEDVIRHQAMDAWRAGVTGKGVRVAVIDAGVDSKHPAFRKPPVAAVNKGLGRRSDGCPMNLGGDHGTSVASAILALAPETEIINIKAGSDGATATVPPELSRDDMFETIIVNAIEEAVKQGAQVLNFSGWSLPVPNSGSPVWNRVTKKIQEVIANGALVVSTTGNRGADSDKNFQNGNLRSISALPEVIGVGAVDYFQRLASFSSRSEVNNPDIKDVYSKPDLVSFGVSVRVAQQSSSYTGGENQLFHPADGTSFAAPQVSAIAAMAIQKLKAQGMSPTPEQVKKLLVDTAIKPEACREKEENCQAKGYGMGMVSLKGVLSRFGPVLVKGSKNKRQK